MIKFRCTFCQKKIGVKDEYAGRAIKCPGCESRIDIPKPEPELAAVSNDMPDLAGLAALEAAAPAQVQAVEAPGRTCPACSAALSEQAVICISCGHSFMKGGKKLDTQVTQETSGSRPPTVGGMGRMTLGLGAASAVALTFSVIWLVVIFISGFELGILAWIGGGLIGLTAGVIGRNPSPIYCGLTACVAAISILGAKAVLAGLATLAFWGVDWVEDFSPENIAVHHAVMEQMMDEGAFAGLELEYAQETVGFYFADDNAQESVIADNQWDQYFQAWDAVDEKVTARADALSEDQRQELLADADARHANWDLALITEGDAELDAAKAELEAEGIGNSFGANFFLTFSLFDLIFFGLAVTTAYSVAYKQGA